ncbi:hypothetical protein [Planctomycetes bacterium K23_9]|uniref:Alpha/beta hydrolase family protein n=1 Tax=Stieleria marina TaxID=1930275 RepID=A0A517NZG2_9BACT|nr:Alpha/beta hydrolase family protein [Planctomycetes bacterium K23_9]
MSRCLNQLPSSGRHPLFCLAALFTTLLFTTLFAGCGLKLPEIKPTEYKPFDLAELPAIELPARPAGQRITQYATEYITDLGIADDQPGHDSEVRVVLPSPMPAGKVPTLIVNGSGAYLFSGMVLSDEDIEPMLPYVQSGFAIVAYETDGCQPSFEREPTPSDIAQMTRQYVASKAGLINAKRALEFALDRFPEIDADQLYTIGHSSGGKQALLLAAHDERIRGSVAFAPACEMEFGSHMTVARIRGADAGTLAHEVNRSMPIVHAKVTDVPMLLLYTPTDQITRPREVLGYAKAVGKKAVAVPVKCSGHGSVPEAGFKLAVAWLRAQAKANAGTSVEPTLVSLAGEDALPEQSSESSDAEQDGFEPMSAEQPGFEKAAAEPAVADLVAEPETVTTVRRTATPVPDTAPETTKPLAVPFRADRDAKRNPAGVQQNPYFSG